MPTYEYACRACDHRFERFQSITEVPVKECPSCGRRQAQRLISGGSGFLFRGSGFYATDYRSEGYKKAAAKEKPGTSTSSESGKSNKKKEAA